MNDAVARLRHWSATAPDVQLLTTRGRAYSYADFTRRAGAVAGWLRAAGLAPGQRVALFLEDYDACFVGMFGVWLSGGIVVPLNTTLPQKDLEGLLAKTRPALLVVSDQAACPADGVVRLVLPRDAEGFVAPGPPVDDADLRPVPPDALAMIMFTSGTSGVPKGVCQTLRGISANAGTVASTLGLTERDRILINTPPYFTSAICHFLTLMAAGGGVAGARGFFFGESLLDELQKLGCTGFGGAPAHLVRVVEPMSEPRRDRTRFWISSGDHLPVPTIEKARRVLPGVRLFNMYGLTEVGGRLCIQTPEGRDEAPDAVGRPIAGMAVAARGPTGALLPPGETGELYVTGPLLMQGYLDEPATTAETLTAHGLRTGDFGQVDAAGNVRVVGRRDDIIKRGAEKVSTVQVQQALATLGLFADVAVIGAPDAILGHVPIAFVVPHDVERFQGSRVLSDLRPLLPSASLPNRILAVREIPRTGSGKVRRLELLKLIGIDG